MSIGLEDIGTDIRITSREKKKCRLRHETSLLTSGPYRDERIRRISAATVFSHGFALHHVISFYGTTIFAFVDCPPIDVSDRWDFSSCVTVIS
jgi:hypothetical protein